MPTVPLPEAARQATRAFGHALRPAQADAIDAALCDRDAIVLLPTGGGKSLCYQIPARARQIAGQGPTLVVSPLVALMDDQVRALQARGVAAVAVHSRARPALDDLRRAALVYASPERLTGLTFRRLLQRAQIAAIAIDEAHCISTWGHDFRPEFRALGELRSTFDVPITALTATATPRALDDIAQTLGLRDPVRVIGDLRRPNLALSVEHIAGDKDRALRVDALVREAIADGGRAIVYAGSRKRVRALADGLKKARLPAEWYHAGRTDAVRAEVQRRFTEGATRVLVATTAFGMGIDVPDVRIVVHAEAPGTLEGWWQEAGRAGRDGGPCRGVLLWSPKDAVLQQRLRGDSPPPGVEAGWRALRDAIEGTGCREQAVLSWLGTTVGPCGLCDACERPDRVREVAAASRARAKDQAIARAEKRHQDLSVEVCPEDLDQIVAFVGGMRRPCARTLVAKALRGSKARLAVRRGLPDVPGHGALAHLPELALIAAIDDLLDAGRLVRKGKKYPTVWLPDRPVRSGPPKARAPKATGLVAALKAFRSREARRRRWRAYMVFDNATLQALADQRPADMSALLAIPGFGPKRAERYGDKLLQLISENPT